MTLNLASLGLTLENMKSFGFTAESAIGAFGAAAVQQFVAQNIGVTATTAQQFNTVDLFNFATKAETAGASQPGTAANITQLLSQTDANVRAATGAGLDNLRFGIAPDGTVNASLDGVAGATTSLNIDDLLAQALADSGMLA